MVQSAIVAKKDFTSGGMKTSWILTKEWIRGKVTLSQKSLKEKMT